jgi:hypothetical protein
MHNPESGNHFPDAGIDWKEEEKRLIEEETTKIGTFLDNLFENLPSHLLRQNPPLVPREFLESFAEKVRTVRFSSLSHGGVGVERIDYHPPQRNEDMLLRAFRIRFAAGSRVPWPEWRINESAKGEGVIYEPYFMEYGRSGENTTPATGNSPHPPSKDPNYQEMQWVLQIMEEAWKRYQEGDEHAVLPSTDPLPPMNRRYRDIEYK